jgi:hypothetical protein
VVLVKNRIDYLRVSTKLDVMKENWFAILLFSLIFGILGFLMGRVTCTTGACAPSSCSPAAAVCCPPGSGVTECVWVQGGEAGENGVRIITKSGDGMDGEVETIIQQLEVADFVGDTTITAGDAVIHMTKSADGQIEVNVEMAETYELEGEGEKVMIKTIKVKDEE